MKKDRLTGNADTLEEIMEALQNAKLLAQENDEDYISYNFKYDEPIDVGAALVLGRPVAQRKQQMTLDYIYKAEDLIEKLIEFLSDHEEMDV